MSIVTKGEKDKMASPDKLFEPAARGEMDTSKGRPATTGPISAMQCGTPPYSIALIYNQSRHSSLVPLRYKVRVIYGTFCDSDVDDSSTFDIRSTKYLGESPANTSG